MSEIVELVENLTLTGWKMMCAAAVLGLGFMILDRRERSREVRAVRPVETERKRRAA